MKSAIKHRIAEILEMIMISSPAGVTHCRGYPLEEEAIDKAMSVITQVACIKTYNHRQKYFLPNLK